MQSELTGLVYYRPRRHFHAIDSFHRKGRQRRQVSDTHWGFNNPKLNPDHAETLRKGIAEINSLQGNPDFLIFTGDETHTTSDPAVRRQRMTEFKNIITGLNIKTIKFIPGEHDAGLDNAEAYRPHSWTGPSPYTGSPMPPAGCSWPFLRQPRAGSAWDWARW